MKKRTKRIVLSSVFIAAILAFIIYYTFPVIGYAFCPDVPILSLEPEMVDELPIAPVDWEEIHVGHLCIKLPMEDIQNVRESEERGTIFFGFESGIKVCIFPVSTLSFDGIDEGGYGYDGSLYSSSLDIVRSMPSDISLFNSRSRNMTAAIGQLMKSMGDFGLYEIAITNPDKLKSISKKGIQKGRYIAFVDLFSEDEESCAAIFVLGCESKESLDEMLYTILGNVSLSNEKANASTIRQDIQRLSTRYKTNELESAEGS